MNPTWLYILYGLLAVGAGGLLLTMPGGQRGRRPVLAGGVIAAAALAGLLVYCVRWANAGAFPMTAMFAVFAFIAVASGVRVVTHPRPVYAALYFGMTVLAVSGLCVLAAAEFLFVALVIVYGGAILVTYVFVIMLAQQSGAAPYDVRAREPLAAVLAGFLLAAAATQSMVKPETPTTDALVTRLAAAQPNGTETMLVPAATAARPVNETEPASIDAAIAGGESNVRAVGKELLTTYVVAVEVAGVLLLVAVVGAIAIAGKRIDPEDLTPQERSAQRAETEDIRKRGREALPF